MLTDNYDRLRRIIHDAMTQYSADQYLKGDKIDAIKQCEFVGIMVAFEAEKEAKKELKNNK
jgi:hypothetical protein